MLYLHEDAGTGHVSDVLEWGGMIAGPTPAVIQNKGRVYISGFTNLSSMSCSDLGCWVYYEDTIPSTPRSEHRPSVPNGGCGP